MQANPSSEGRTVLAAASLVAAVLGSVHAFSVFLSPLEAQFEVSRSAVSLTYSMALVCLTIVVLIGPRLYARWSAARVMGSACMLAALGAILAGSASSIGMVWVGYSLIFGAANGLGYGYGLQIAAQVNPGREGFAMGVVTAAYAFGAVIAPMFFEAAVATGGFRRAMTVLAIALIASGLVSVVLLHRAGARFKGTNDSAKNILTPHRNLPLLWLAYFGGVLAGLMVIGHAAGIAAALRPHTAAWIAPMVIAGCNLTGALLAGRLADALPSGRLLATLALLTTLALLSLGLFGHTAALLPAFGLIGFAYGGTIAVYPAAIAKLYGMQDGPRIYGRVFTAWGAAGLLGPWFAGYLFDVSDGYTLALFTAAGIAVVSVVTLTRVFRGGGVPG